jgi:hypothetical protein
LPRLKAPRGGDLFDERLDIRAEELVRAITVLANEMEVSRVAVRVLEAEAAFAEIHLAGDAGVHHPLQRAVNGGPADPLIFALGQRDEIVGTEVPLLTEKHIDDQIALARPLGAGRSQSIEIRQRSRHAKSCGLGLEARGLLDVE